MRGRLNLCTRLGPFFLDGCRSLARCLLTRLLLLVRVSYSDELGRASPRQDLGSLANIQRAALTSILPFLTMQHWRVLHCTALWVCMGVLCIPRSHINFVALRVRNASRVSIEHAVRACVCGRQHWKLARIVTVARPRPCMYMYRSVMSFGSTSFSVTSVSQ